MAKILVVDDERSIRSTLTELLQMEGHTVISASNGAEALQSLEGAGVELVISDIKMPQMDGAELLEKIKAQYPLTQIVMISGHGTIETAVECLHKGAADFVEKPIEMNRLLSSVRGAWNVGS